MFIRQNPWRYNAPPGWNDISSAPRDGTPIEIQNNWGVAPHFGICKWDDGGWRYANNPNMGMGDGPHLSWRPYNGSASAYVDPTGGEQNTRAYWLHACGRPDLAIAAGDERLDDPVPSPQKQAVLVKNQNLRDDNGAVWTSVFVGAAMIAMTVCAGVFRT